MAAVIAGGPDAALSHGSAAQWGLQRGEPTIIDVTAKHTVLADRHAA